MYAVSSRFAVPLWQASNVIVILPFSPAFRRSLWIHIPNSSSRKWFSPSYCWGIYLYPASYITKLSSSPSSSSPLLSIICCPWQEKCRNKTSPDCTSLQSLFNALVTLALVASVSDNWIIWAGKNFLRDNISRIYTLSLSAWMFSQPLFLG